MKHFPKESESRSTFALGAWILKHFCTKLFAHSVDSNNYLCTISPPSLKALKADSFYFVCSVVCNAQHTGLRSADDCWTEFKRKKRLLLRVNGSWDWIGKLIYSNPSFFQMRRVKALTCSTPHPCCWLGNDNLYKSSRISNDLSVLAQHQ